MSRLFGLIRGNWLTLLIIGVLVVGYVLLRNSPSRIDSADEFVASLQGQPTVVAFYSNF